MCTAGRRARWEDVPTTQEVGEGAALLFLAGDLTDEDVAVDVRGATGHGTRISRTNVSAPGQAGGTWTSRTVSIRSGNRPSRRALASCADRRRYVDGGQCLTVKDGYLATAVCDGDYNRYQDRVLPVE
ncbi:hypothetical protein ABT126_45870 [Streptomyces sp. NPDC002012]|uniref:hypothetical protein n=1 Tax=Streptomyces sp. NPDC002012 TaxID=3154532 RepID=UPI0033334489